MVFSEAILSVLLSSGIKTGIDFGVWIWTDFIYFHRYYLEPDKLKVWEKVIESYFIESIENINHLEKGIFLK